MPHRPVQRCVRDVADVLAHVRATPGSAYALQTPELYDMLTYGDGLKAGDLRLGLGNWNQGHGMLRAVLTYLAQRAFAIHRLPWHHDRSCSQRCRDDAAGTETGALHFLSDGPRVERVCDELRALQAHTQRLLATCGATHVRLRRGLRDVEDKRTARERVLRMSGYATRTATLASLATQLGRSEFEMPVDVLTSWGGGGYAHYDVVIEHEVPIEAVLCFSAALASRYAGRTDALEADEWIVLNRATDGRLRLAAACVVKCNLTLPPMTGWTPKRMTAELVELGQVYGTAASMYEDRPDGARGRVRWARRLLRAFRGWIHRPR